MRAALAILLTLAADLSGQAPTDPRPGPARTFRDAYHPWTPPATRRAFELAAARMRTEVRVALGLWPEPPRTPLEPRFGRPIVRDGFSARSVAFPSLPGFVVTGTLFRPHPPRSGRGPAVLSPHGHWPGGRLHDAGDAAARRAIQRGGERFLAAARHPLQARMVQLARLGCTGLLYDMVGYGSSRGLAHGKGFSDLEALLHLHGTAGLQTWNSIRALDLLCSLADVDPHRVGVTGASGGGTQTFLLGALDPRPAVAFPAVMVSTAMQGGCVCENAPYLRIERNNIALAALFAPRPLAMSGADDWTRDLETRGLPELRAVYRLFGAERRVGACVFSRFPHNFNAPARACMVGWFARHLGLQRPPEERDFRPLTAEELAVRAPPADVGKIRSWRERVVREQLEELLRAPRPLAAWRRVVGVAAEVLLGGPPPRAAELRVVRSDCELLDGGTRRIHAVVVRPNEERVAVTILSPRRHGTLRCSSCTPPARAPCSTARAGRVRWRGGCSGRDARWWRPIRSAWAPHPRYASRWTTAMRSTPSATGGL